MQISLAPNGFKALAASPPVPSCMSNIAMAQPVLKQACVGTLVRKHVATCMPQHVWMDVAQASPGACILDKVTDVLPCHLTELETEE